MGFNMYDLQKSVFNSHGQVYYGNPQIYLGILSCLPTEILMELINYLPIPDVFAFTLIGRNIHPIIEKNLYERTQKYLEILECDLLKQDSVKEELLESYNEYPLFSEKVKNASDSSKEKCQALRESISSLFFSINHALTLSPYQSEDPLLLPHLFKVLTDDFKTFIKFDKENMANFSLFFKMLERGHVITRHLHLDICDVVDEKSLMCVTSALCNDKYKSIFFISDKCNALQNKILDLVEDRLI